MPRSSPPEDDAPPGDALEAAEAKAAFHLRMRARGVRDLAVLRAFERVPRARFVPPRHLDLAGRDLPLPIGCGQTMHEPWLVARMIEALGVEPHHRVLEVGSGTGYATALLSHLAAEVLGLERFGSLARAAQARLEGLGIANAAVVWGDGLALPATTAGFDRVLVHGALAEVPPSLAERLKADGCLVAALVRADGQEIVRMERRDGRLAEGAIVCACRLQSMSQGLALAM